MSTYCVRHASGNVMSLYEHFDQSKNKFFQKEIHLYGSRRLGVHNVNVNVYTDTRVYETMLGVTNNQAELFTFERGNKFFELSNHHGNVDTLLQDFGSSANSPNAMNTTGNRFKKIVYDYDLISGKVKAVAYQPGQTDAFYHRYNYDAENRLVDVETSNDKVVWERDARYSYYRHGALARTVLGNNQVQGIDYAYTLQGQLKGINSTSVGDGIFDMGQDGKIGSSNSNIARDAYGISLNYFTGDYKPINNTVIPFANIGVANDLFNSNIKSMVVNIPKLGDPLIYGFKYDQLNRLVAMDAYNGLNNTSNTFTAITINDYKERLSYDANGNIKTYLRNGTGATINLNNYSYTYTAGTNKLASITNSVNAQTKNYAYDPIGNTTTDGMQNMTNAVWNVYGKLQSATNKDGASVTYTYSASGQRISKKVGTKEEWYVKDATGNSMATYSKDPAVNNNDLTATSFYKYGSSLIDVMDAKINVEHPVANNGSYTKERGNDNYILVDGNGNTKATIRDTRTQVPDPANPALVLYYTANVSTATFSSTYGANAKTFNGGFAAANFNGQRKSLEIGNDAQTAEFWEVNNDVGIRLNLDPKPESSFSPYSIFRCNPILNMDPLGDTSIVFGQDGKEIDRNTTQKGMNFYMVDKEKYTALKGKNADAYNKDYNGFEKNMISELGAAKQKGTISAEVTGTAYETGEVYTKGADVKKIQGMAGDGKLTFNIPFDNGKMANLSFEINMGGLGAGLTPNGDYKSSGFKKGYEGNLHPGDYTYSNNDRYGFKVPMLPIDVNVKRTEILYHPTSIQGTEGCTAVKNSKDAYMIRTVFSSVFTIQKSIISTVKITGNGNIMFNVSKDKSYKKSGSYSPPPKK